MYCLMGFQENNFTAKEGLVKGTLSPLLFFLAADLLQTILNEAMNANLIQAPHFSHSNQDFLVIQYVDDTILIMPVEEPQILHLNNLLAHFSAQIGLKINYSKSVLVPLNVPDENLNIIIDLLVCKLGNFPLTYLGLLSMMAD